MPLTIEVTPRGPSALWDGRRLTSAYAPEREAREWADSLKTPPGSLVFVAGDPWGLASEALLRRGITAVALLPGSESLPHVPGSVRAWAPGSASLESFLEGLLDEQGPDSVVWQVWPAFERLAPELSLEWAKRFRDVYRAEQGSWLTYRRFGPRYWSNAIRNFVGWEQRLTWTPGRRAVVIAASGPSLDDGLERLVRHRSEFDLWALPSSFETLVRRGLQPDVGVATDGGFYAREHLHRLTGTSVPVLASLSSAADLELTRRPVGFFSQGLGIERTLLDASGLTALEVPSQGTVAVTALRLALEATTGPVLIAGLDLSFRDLRGHTSPHTVDRRFEAEHHRLLPGESQWARRLYEQATLVQDGVRTSPALLTYARWFQTRARFRRTVYRIAPTPLRWESMTDLSWSEAQQLWQQHPGHPVAWATGDTIPRAQRLSCARSVLLSLAKQATSADERWLNAMGRTAVPEALAEDWRARRAGKPSQRIREELPRFLMGLLEALA